MDRAALEKRFEELRGRHLIRARRSLAALIALLALAVVGRVALDPPATHLTRKQLAELDGFRGHVAGVHVGVFPPSYPALADGAGGRPQRARGRAGFGVRPRRAAKGDAG